MIVKLNETKHQNQQFYDNDGNINNYPIIHTSSIEAFRVKVFNHKV